jgi:D-alanine-D-alanine ligase
MQVAILHPSYDGSNAPFKDLDPECDPARFLPEAEITPFYIGKATAVRQICEIARMGFDVAINLCDGAWDEDRAGIEVVRTLERCNLAFTGAGSLFFDPSREAMKMAAHAAGVKFPAYVLARRPVDVDRALARLRFPLIVKHPNSYSSIGMTPNSRVTDPGGLRREVARITQAYGGALIEEFIEGREFTVLVTESRNPYEGAWPLQPVEFVFPEGESFKHFDLKWKAFEEMQTRPVTEAELTLRLQDAATRVFLGLEGSGYARCDFRTDSAGEVYFLEINPNCGIFYPDGQFGSADLILAADPAGPAGFLRHLVECAIRRRDRLLPVWELQFDRERGFGLFASRPVAKGQLVERYEERPHVIASRTYIEANWRGLRREWFEKYAWPLTDDVYGLWSSDPSDWRPINHSCDPNTWLDGLDLVARRAIPRGEEITLDYATFCGPSMASFTCRCGSAECRRVITGMDFRKPELQSRYGDHISAFVRSHRSSSVPVELRRGENHDP